VIETRGDATTEIPNLFDGLIIPFLVHDHLQVTPLSSPLSRATISVAERVSW
jgi:hypothetical protein